MPTAKHLLIFLIDVISYWQHNLELATWLENALL